EKLRETSLEVLQESIKIKKEGYVYPGSLAASQSEYAQFLAEEGNFQEAISCIRDVLQEIEKLVEAGQYNAIRERAAYQVDLGQHLLLIGHLNEAERIFENALPLLVGTVRDSYAVKARQGLQAIQTWREASPQGLLDYRWFETYAKEIANFDTFTWLSP